MKKLLCIIALTVAFIIATGAFAEATISAEGSIEAVAGAALPEVGASVDGFRLDEIMPIASNGSNVYTFTHEKTGARVVWVSNDDTNREFAIGFKTKPWNDEGLAHVFEHATLCGNEKYPDPSLFFSMIGQTYNTFLNAMTFSSMTIFPSASLSEDQLAVFMDYTLNGVFHPIIMQDERAMMREAYRYELTDADADLTLTGTVYSEMSAALNASAMLTAQLNRLMYPGSFYGHISGGDPDYIPDMTWDELKRFHDSYYHPSNSMSVLYGDLDVYRFLKALNECFSTFEYAEITVEDDQMQPAEGFCRADFTFPASADSTAETTIQYAFRLPDLSAQDLLRMSIAAYAMGSESSPLTIAVRDAYPHSTLSVNATLETSFPTLIFQLRNANVEDAENFRALVDDAIALWLKDGLDQSALDAAASSVRFATALSGESSLANGTTTNLLYFWSHYDDPAAYVRYDDAMMHLADDLVNDVFNVLAVRCISDPACTALVTMTTVPGMQEEKNAALAEALREKKAAMSAEEIDALVARTADFAAWTQANAANSMIDEMKAVDAQSLPEEVAMPENPAIEETIDGVRFITCAVADSDITNVNLMMDAGAVPMDMLNAYSLYTDIMNCSATEKYTVEELDSLLARYFSGSLSIYASASEMENGSSWMPIFGANWSMLKGEEEQAIDLVRQRLLHADDSDVEFIRDCMKRKQMQLKSRYESDPANALQDLLNAYVGGISGYMYAISARPYLEYLADFLDMDDAHMAETIAAGRDAMQYALNRSNLTVMIIGDSEGIAAAKERVLPLIAEIPESDAAHADYTAQFLPDRSGLGITIDSNVYYNIILADRDDMSCEYTGADEVMSAIIADALLIPELRFKNSAYGAGFHTNKYGTGLYSYRDPNFEQTFDYYDRLADALAALDLTQDDIDGYITSAFSGLAMPTGPLNRAQTAANDLFSGEDSFAKKAQYMRDVKSVTPESVREYADVIAKFVENGVRYSIGFPEQINAHADMFDEILSLSDWLGVR